MEEFYLEENHEIPSDVLRDSIRKNTINLNFCPVFMGSAFKNKGVQLLLDGVISFLPNPKEVTNIALDTKNDEAKVELEINDKKPFVGLAFKLEET
jgi:elongation factor G